MIIRLEQAKARKQQYAMRRDHQRRRCIKPAWNGT
jgi:hypothetical protein